MKICPRCNQKTFNTASICECGHTFADESIADSPPSILVHTFRIHRPISVTVICSFFILCALLEAVMTVFDAIVDMTYFSGRLADKVALTILLFAYGLGMLKRQNWVRLLYLWLTPLFGILSLFYGAAPLKWVVALILYV